MLSRAVLREESQETRTIVYKDLNSCASEWKMLWPHTTPISSISRVEFVQGSQRHMEMNIPGEEIFLASNFLSLGDIS